VGTDRVATIDHQDDSQQVAGRRTVLAFAGLGALSALASTYLPGASFNFAGFDILPPPGIYFGLALGLGTWLLCGWGASGGAIVWAATFAAWMVAFEVAMEVTTILGNIGVKEIAGIDVQNFIAGLVAGAVGAAITFCGACFAAPNSWNTRRLYAVTALGAGLGLLLEPAIEGDGSMLLALFLPWQVAVAALIGRYMSRPAVPARR